VLGVCALAAAVLLSFWSSREPAALEARLEGRAVGSGSFVQAREQARVVEFSDGTEMRLEAGGVMRLERLTQQGARVVLESGEIEARVTPRRGAHWSVEAGPYTVQVTGTRFTVRWEPAREGLDVALSEGSVEVSGPGIEGSRRLAAGEHLALGRAEERPSSEASMEEATGTEPVEEPVPEPIEDRDERHGTGRLSRPRSPSSVDWQGMLEARRYREAIVLARAQGLERICAAESAQRLLRLADAARFARDVEAGEQVLGCVRVRFPRSAAGAEAAFFLGRIALESRRDGRDAVRWLALSLSEASQGPFAEQAAGQLIEARELAGDSQGARRAAEAYLARHPRGIYAELAGRLVHGAPH